MQFKTCDVIVKAAGEADGLEDGQFEAIVSAFGNVDSYGDVVMPGAFKDTLKEWADSGDPIPVYWSHRMDDPDYNIGFLLDAKEVPEGLWVKGQLDLDEGAKKAAQVYRLMKGRRVTQFSFAYDVLDGGYEKRQKAGSSSVDDTEEFFALRKLKVYEVGPTPIGANQSTDLLAVKAAANEARAFVADVKAGRVISAKNETNLRDALTSLEDSAAQIKNVLSALDSDDGNDDSKAKPSEPGKDDEPTPVKSDDPMRLSPASVRLRLDVIDPDGALALT